MKDEDARLIDNAAACSQHKALTDDESVRECIYLNVIKPLRKRIAALEAALETEKSENGASEEELKRLLKKWEEHATALEAENERLREALASIVLVGNEDAEKHARPSEKAMIRIGSLARAALAGRGK